MDGKGPQAQTLEVRKMYWKPIGGHLYSQGLHPANDTRIPKPRIPKDPCFVPIQTKSTAINRVKVPRIASLVNIIM